MLRGVNVGGAGRLPMAGLRALLEGLGLARVQTHIQSGNAVFLGARAGLEARIRAGLEAGFGLRVPVFVLSLDEMAAVLAENPFAAEGRADGSRVHIHILQGAVRLEPGLQAHATRAERFHLTERAFYLHTPQGFGTSAVAAKLERYLKGTTTARNQRSASAILALARGLTGT